MEHEEQKESWNLIPGFFDEAAASDYFLRLMKEVPFSQNETAYGKERRLSCWMSDAGSYRYSGIRRQAVPLTPLVREILDIVKEQFGVPFNSVLVNLYRHGKDVIGWHGDDVRDLEVTDIASLSLGAARKFRLRPRDAVARRNNRVKTGTEWMEYELRSGDMVHMFGSCQTEYQHQVPQQAAVKTPRINLTFRVVKQNAA